MKIKFHKIKFKKEKILSGLRIFAIFAMILSLSGLFIEKKTGFFTKITSNFFNSLGDYSEEVKELDVESDGYKDKTGGSYKITQSADWTALSTATIHFDVETIAKSSNVHKDLVFVLDTSSSMTGEKISEVKNEFKELTSKLLEDQESRIAIITFNKDAQVVSDLTSDKETLLGEIDKIEAHATEGKTSYYKGLKSVEQVLGDYSQKENTELVVLFLTDGLPNVDTPNQKGEYQKLKVKFPYMKVISIQYEMGNDIKPEINEISDEQFLANLNGLHNEMFNVVLLPMTFDSFEVVDYIDNDYFKLEDQSKIQTTIGNAVLQDEDGNQKIVWTFNKGELHTGNNLKMDVEVKLNTDLRKKEGFYPTTKKIEVKSILDGTNNDTTNTNTPVLQHGYKVTYKGNMPKGCSDDYSKEETHFAFESVKIENNELSCKNYLFKGWKIKETVQMLNEETFIMPQGNITISSLWTSVGVQKSTEGSVSEKVTLYRTIASQAVPDNVRSEYVDSDTGIDFSQVSSDTNGKGVYTIADTKGTKYPVHYFRGEVNNNNVIFGGFCWQIVRTTETGGVKLIYNGKAQNKQCPEGRTYKDRIIFESTFNDSGSLAFVGYKYPSTYNPSISKSISFIGLTGLKETSMYGVQTSKYYYSDKVTYDAETDLYTLVDPEDTTWTSSNHQSFLHKYTCRAFNDRKTCNQVAYVTQTRSNYIYYTNFSNGDTAETFLKDYTIIYGNDVEYENGVYKLINTYEGNINNWDNDYNKIKQKNAYRYTCFNENDTCSSVNYIYYAELPSTAGAHGYAYYVELNNGEKIEDAISKMLVDGNNDKGSIVSDKIDAWYVENLRDEYGDMLEDTIWCDDRTIGFYSGWSTAETFADENTNQRLNFSTKYRLRDKKIKLTCENINDRFTVSEEVGNGDLLYPIALLTLDEGIYAGFSYSYYKQSQNIYLNANGSFWFLTPDSFSATYPSFHSIISYSNEISLSSSRGNESRGVRPSVSLRPGITYSSGNGTPEQPYIIDIQ